MTLRPSLLMHQTAPFAPLLDRTRTASSCVPQSPPYTQIRGSTALTGSKYCSTPSNPSTALSLRGKVTLSTLGRTSRWQRRWPSPGAWRWMTNKPTRTTVPWFWRYRTACLQGTDIKHRPNCATNATRRSLVPIGRGGGSTVTGIHPPPNMVNILGVPSGPFPPYLPRPTFTTLKSLLRLSYPNATTHVAKQKPTLPAPHTPPISVPVPKSNHIHRPPPRGALHTIPDELGELLVSILAHCHRDGFFGRASTSAAASRSCP